MKRLILILTLVLLTALGTAYAQDDHGGEAHPGASIEALRGAAIYAEFCQTCHGVQGAALSPGFPTLAFDAATARDVIEQGRAPMPAYGPLFSDAQFDDLLAYLHTWESGDVPPLPEPNIHDVPDHVADYSGDPHAGAVVYAKSCAGCHGADGEGRDAPGFPAFEFDAETIAFVSTEHVPAFGTTAGGPLNDTQLTDLESYLASWDGEKANDEQKSEGINVLIVVTGALAIVAIGGAYLSRVIETEQA